MEKPNKKIEQFPENNIIDEWLANYRAKKIGDRTLIVSAILVLIIFMLCSCGARKVDREKTVVKEVSQSESVKIDSSKTVTVSDANTKIIDTGTEEEFIIVPIDSTKEMVVNSVIYKNAVLKHSKKINNKVVDKSENVQKTAQNNVKQTSKSQSSKTTIVEVKKTERKANFWWLLWLLLLIPIYIAYKKYGRFFS